MWRRDRFSCPAARDATRAQGSIFDKKKHEASALSPASSFSKYAHDMTHNTDHREGTR